MLRAVARAKWARAARTPGHPPDPLAAEVASRHADALGALRLPAGRVLDCGSGAGRWPGAAPAVRLDWVTWPGTAVVGDASALPFAAGTFAVVWSNLCLPWVGPLATHFTEARRVLQEGGLLTLTTLGPATLAGLRAGPGTPPRVLAFPDMHDLADLAGAAGFADPVATREDLEFTYADGRSLLAELRTHGMLAVPGMDLSLGSRAGAAALQEAARAARLGFEIIHLHAWAMPRRRPKGPGTWQEIEFMPPPPAGR